MKNILVILLIIIAIVMIVMGSMSKMIPPVLTGIGFLIISILFVRKQ